MLRWLRWRLTRLPWMCLLPLQARSLRYCSRLAIRCPRAVLLPVSTPALVRPVAPPNLAPDPPRLPAVELARVGLRPEAVQAALLRRGAGRAKPLLPPPVEGGLAPRFTPMR